MANPRVALCSQGPVDGGTAINDGKASLADAFRRMVAVIQLDHAINGSYDGLPVLAGVNVAVRSPDDKVLMCYLLTACTIPLDVFLILYMLCVLMCCTFRADKSYKLTTYIRNPIYARIKVSKKCCTQ